MQSKRTQARKQGKFKQGNKMQGNKEQGGEQEQNREGRKTYEEVIEQLATDLAQLPNTPEMRRKALLLRKYLVAEESGRTKLGEIQAGIFSDSFSEEEAALGNRLFNLIKDEFQLENTKDLMDLHLMIMNYLKTRRLMGLEFDNIKLKNALASIIKKFTDAYSALGRDLAINRQQRLIRKIEYEDETGSITKIFASVQQYEEEHPEEVIEVTPLPPARAGATATATEEWIESKERIESKRNKRSTDKNTKEKEV